MSGKCHYLVTCRHSTSKWQRLKNLNNIKIVPWCAKNTHVNSNISQITFGPIGIAQLLYVSFFTPRVFHILVWPSGSQCLWHCVFLKSILTASIFTLRTHHAHLVWSKSSSLCLWPSGVLYLGNSWEISGNLITSFHKKAGFSQVVVLKSFELFPAPNSIWLDVRLQIHH